MTDRQKDIIRDNLNAFINNFGPIRIEESNGFYIFCPADSDDYVQYCYNIDYFNGWLFGAVQGLHGQVKPIKKA